MENYEFFFSRIQRAATTTSFLDIFRSFIIDTSDDFELLCHLLNR